MAKLLAEQANLSRIGRDDGDVARRQARVEQLLDLTADDFGLCGLRRLSPSGSSSSS